MFEYEDDLKDGFESERRALKADNVRLLAENERLRQLLDEAIRQNRASSTEGNTQSTE